jgi:hypothetical protein
MRHPPLKGGVLAQGGVHTDTLIGVLDQLKGFYAGHLRDGWARPIGADTFAGAIPWVSQLGTRIVRESG